MFRFGMEKIKATPIAYLLFPAIWFLVALTVDVSCYQFIIDHYNIFGFDSELRSGLIVLALFTLMPIFWAVAIIYNNAGRYI